MKTKTILPNMQVLGIAVILFGIFVSIGNDGKAYAQTSTTTATTTQNQATTTATTTPRNYKVLIMKHLCPSYVRDMQDFNNLLANRDEPTGFINAEFHCPTTVVNGNSPYPGSIYSTSTAFNFQIWNWNDVATSTRTLVSNGTFVQSRMCETDINRDINLNGTIASSTCLDASHYEVPVTSTSSKFMITESTQPNGYQFGTVLFTPPSISANNDMQNLTSINSQSGVINLDMASDTDNTIVLHVFNFMKVATTTPPPPATTTATSTADLAIEISNLSNLIRELQTKVDNLISQIQILITRIGTGNTGSPGGGTGGVVDSIARVRAASSSVVMGDTNDFAGDHFGPSEQVVISTEGQTIMTVMTDKEGNFGTGSIYMPRSIGEKVYTFRGVTSGKQVSVVVRVLPIP